MRTALFFATASLLVLSACGGPETSQANNTQANIAGTDVPPATAQGSALTDRTTAAAPQEAKTVMHERHEGMEAIGKANKAIKRELDGSSPDLATVRTNASKINELVQKSAHWFPPGTGPDVGKTGAKMDIWEKPQDFGAKLTEFQAAAQAFDKVASGSDVAAIKAAFDNLGKSCKACHDSYRSEMKH